MKRVAILLLLPSLAFADASAPAPTRDVLVKQALTLVGAWVEAQNKGDAAGYAALYDPAHFKGVKRTTRGGAKTFDWKGWLADRTAMLAKHPKVEAVSPSVTTWEDPRSKLKSGVVAVKFIQRWRSERYADHGTKVLHLLAGPSGKLLIIYEDLLGSVPGWDAQAASVAKLVLTAPENDEAALEAWKKIGPTGRDVDAKLDGIPGQPSVTRSLARALLHEGNFACDKIDSANECGDETLSWLPLDPKAGIDDPCLRRRLADWALTKGNLSEADVTKIADDLEGLLSLKEPETDLPEHLMALVDSMSTALRLRFLHAAPAALAEQHMSGLPDGAIAEMYAKDHLDAAALSLNPTRDRKLLIAALTDDKLKVETRGTLIDKLDLKGADVTAALIAVADLESDCGLAMNAALTLEERGDKSHLPRRPKEETDAAFSRALCMLVHDTDKARQLARYKEFLPPRGKVKVSEHIDDEFAERDEDGNRIDTSPPDEFFTRKSITEFNIASEFGTVAGSGHVGTDYGGSYELTFDTGKDGKLYLVEIHRETWRGCPC